MSARRKYAADASLDDPWDCRGHGRHKPVGSERDFAPPPGGCIRQPDHRHKLLMPARGFRCATWPLAHPEPVDMAVHHGQSAAGHARADSAIGAFRDFSPPAHFATLRAVLSRTAGPVRCTRTSASLCDRLRPTPLCRVGPCSGGRQAGLQPSRNPMSLTCGWIGTASGGDAFSCANGSGASGRTVAQNRGDCHGILSRVCTRSRLKSHNRAGRQRLGPGARRGGR